jgi:hypothetical protein
MTWQQLNPSFPTTTIYLHCCNYSIVISQELTTTIQSCLCWHFYTFKPCLIHFPHPMFVKFLRIPHWLNGPHGPLLLDILIIKSLTKFLVISHIKLSIREGSYDFCPIWRNILMLCSVMIITYFLQSLVLPQ